MQYGALKNIILRIVQHSHRVKYNTKQINKIHKGIVQFISPYWQWSLFTNPVFWQPTRCVPLSSLHCTTLYSTVLFHVNLSVMYSSSSLYCTELKLHFSSVLSVLSASSPKARKLSCSSGSSLLSGGGSLGDWGMVTASNLCYHIKDVWLLSNHGMSWSRNCMT